MQDYIYDCAPPDPKPVPPTFPVPALACDTHFHIFGPYQRYPLAQPRLFTPPAATWQDCIRMHDAIGIQRGVVVHSVANGVDPKVSYDALVALNGRWRGIALMDDKTSDYDLGGLNEAGFRGVRLNFVDLGATAEQMSLSEQRIARYGWHIQLLVRLDRIEALMPAIRRLKVPCVIDHMGFTRAKDGIAHPGFQAMLALLREGRCWVKVSGADRVGDPAQEYANARPFMQALVDANPDQLVWGTDWPHIKVRAMPNDGMLLNLFGAWVQDPGVRERILVRNPARLYGFA